MLDNLWWSNSNNLCAPIFVPILYVVFQRMYNVHKPVRTICMIFIDFTRFLSMLPILHGQSVYNMYKPVKTICMIFIDLIRFFSPGSTKTALVNRQNRSVYWISVHFTDSIKKSSFEFCTGFYRVFLWNRQNWSSPISEALPIFQTLLCSV
jgi:hypothetical protein